MSGADTRSLGWIRQSLGIEVMRVQLLMCPVVSGGRSLGGNRQEGLVNVKVVANVSRFNREMEKAGKMATDGIFRMRPYRSAGMASLEGLPVGRASGQLQINGTGLVKG